MAAKSDQIESGGGISREQVADDFDRLVDEYEDKINDSLAFSGMEHTFFIDKKREKLVELAAAHFGDLNEIKVLDLGCGLGAYHPGLEGVFGELHGADVSAKSVALAAENHPFVRYSTISGSRLPYADETFDMVYTVCVMHHVVPAEWGEFVCEMKRVLRPGGLGLVFEHNPYNPATQYIVRTCEIDKDAVLLRPSRLRELFRAAGFEAISTRTVFSVPPIGAALSAIDSVFGRLPFGAQYYLRALRGG
ncbi:MAG TPA: methyltransferase domain-containing protein [Afifellaceae bacterium]|nr:methyltransferase domain-containing protein [Afifellaceae bacterium]